MKRLKGTKELTNFQRKKMEKKIAKQQAVSQEQREETFSELKNEKMKNERINQPSKHRYYPKDLDNFIRDNERKPMPSVLLHIQIPCILCLNISLYYSYIYTLLV